MSNAMQQAGNNPIALMRSYLKNTDVVSRLEETLGKRAGAFSNSIINVVKGNAKLQKCEPGSVLSAAMVAATMNLAIDPALGYAAIVPYKTKATFQIMYKGMTQLCIRSGQYKTIHCTAVYADEIKSYNPITGEVVFNDPDKFKLRYEDCGNADIVGHYAHFELLSGFVKSDYMTTKEVMAHAKKYSKSYQYDLRDKKKSSRWSTDPIPMANKTVLLRLLSKYGVMSIEMQSAVVADYESFETSQANAEQKIKDSAGSETIEAEFEEPETPVTPETQDDDSWKNAD